ncbi:MAG: hypothetical protein FWF94_07455 [Oscillospiraceae bacterium]|nr:hypothetical protein [Oscillospiraceae bacterium]
MKRVFAAICAICLTYTMSLTVGAMAYNPLNNINELIYEVDGRYWTGSELIITGNVIDVWEVADEVVVGNDVSMASVKVTEVLYGNTALNGETIVVRGLSNDMPEDYHPEPGQDYLFFIKWNTFGHPSRLYEIDGDGNVLGENYINITSVDMVRSFLPSFDKGKLSPRKPPNVKVDIPFTEKPRDKNVGGASVVIEKR